LPLLSFGPSAIVSGSAYPISSRASSLPPVASEGRGSAGFQLGQINPPGDGLSKYDVKGSGPSAGRIAGAGL